ncbi:MAG TPA: response regulator [Alphaproteobacteria bacterium]|nr:response regulator [Alphaproteobacteria bacterium]
MSRILIIDDDPAFRKMVRSFLEAEGHEVIDATCGEEGLALFRSHAPELIVTDIVMPGLSGVETIERIREENPDMKIIAVSGRDGVAAAAMLPDGRRGADRGLEKPFRRGELVETVDALLPKRPDSAG